MHTIRAYPVHMLSENGCGTDDASFCVTEVLDAVKAEAEIIQFIDMNNETNDSQHDGIKMDVKQRLYESVKGH